MHRNGDWRVIFGIAIVLCVSCVLCVLLPKIETEQTLPALDEHFVTPSAPLSADASEILMVPQPVGDFHLSATGQSMTRIEHTFDYSKQQDLSTRYIASNYDAIVDAVLNPNAQIEDLADAGTSPCAADIGGENFSRTAATTLYTYHACANTIFGLGETVVRWKSWTQKRST